MKKKQTFDWKFYGLWLGAAASVVLLSWKLMRPAATRRDVDLRPMVMKKSRGQRVLEIAEAEWRRPVRESKPEGLARINDYIKSEQGLGWNWGDDYSKDSDFMWCGAFAAFGHQEVRLDLRKEHYASTSRLFSWARNTPRWIEPENLQPGDVFVVGNAKEYLKETTGKPDREGRHIGIVISVDPASGTISTFEGNARGKGPDGEQYWGVVQGTRKIPYPGQKPKEWRVRYGVRPLEEDYA